MVELRKVLLTIMVSFCLLQHAFTITTVNIEKRGIKYTTDLTGTTTTLKLTVDKALLASSLSNMYLIIYGDAHTLYDIRAGEKGNLKLACNGADWTICILDLNDERPYFNGFRGYQVEITLQERIKGLVGFAVDDNIMGDIAIPYTIIGKSLNNLKLRFFGTNDQVYQKLRYEFIALTTTHQADKTSISAIGNFGTSKGWPSNEQHDFSFKHLHGTEIATVFDAKDPHFCAPNSKCEYKFLVTSQNVHTINVNSNFASHIEPLVDNMNFVGRFDSVRHSETTRHSPRDCCLFAAH